jgi:hypothetical protein
MILRYPKIKNDHSLLDIFHSNQWLNAPASRVVPQKCNDVKKTIILFCSQMCGSGIGEGHDFYQVLEEANQLYLLLGPCKVPLHRALGMGAIVAAIFEKGNLSLEASACMKKLVKST